MGTNRSCSLVYLEGRRKSEDSFPVLSLPPPTHDLRILSHFFLMLAKDSCAVGQSRLTQRMPIDDQGGRGE